MQHLPFHINSSSANVPRHLTQPILPKTTSSNLQHACVPDIDNWQTTVSNNSTQILTYQEHPLFELQASTIAVNN